MKWVHTIKSTENDQCQFSGRQFIKFHNNNYNIKKFEAIQAASNHIYPDRPHVLVVVIVIKRIAAPE